MGKYLDKTGLQYFYNKLKERFVDKTNMASSLEALPIYTDNTDEHKAANLANIKAYEDNLKAMGVDVTEVHSIPIVCSFKNLECWGVLSGRTTVQNLSRFNGIITYSNDDSYVILVNEGGTFFNNEVLCTALQISTLTTTAKQIIPAINEVNTLAKSKAALGDVIDNITGDVSDLSDDIQGGTIVKSIAKLNNKVNTKASTDVATTSTNGLMSSADKKKLDGVAEGATRVTTDTVSGWGFTKNAGTVTGVKINGTTKTPTDGVVDLGTVSGGDDPIILNPGTTSITNAEFAKLMNAVGTRSAYYNVGEGCYFSLIHASSDSGEAVFRFERPSPDGQEYVLVYTEPYDSAKETIDIVDRGNTNTVFSNEGYQLMLKSGTNIKTINGQSILGSGNLTVSSSVTTDTTMSDTSTNPVQNKVIKTYVDNLVGTAITQLANI